MKTISIINTSITMKKILALLIITFSFVFFNNTLIAQDKGTSLKIDDYKKRLGLLLEPKIEPYDALGKNDPFIPFIRQQVRVAETEDRPGKCENPVECLDVGQLQVVAIVRFESGKSIAMVQDATTQGYVLSEGMRIGYRDGRVKSITKEGVVITETAKDLLGNQVKTEKILLINPEGR